MANITEDLEKILSSRYGKDVRQAIHDSISDINDVAESYEWQASASAESARLSAQSASTSAFNASESERYCRGVETQFSNAFIYCGTKTFAELMDLNIMLQKTGNCFNISDDFTSTEEFEDGGGKSYKAGTNVACTSNHKWDCLASDGGGGTSVGIELTQAEYDALPSSKLTDGVDYYITDATQSPFNVVEVTQAEYDALTDAQKNVGQYFITDVNILMIHGKASVPSADKIKYDDNQNVKEAIDELNSKFVVDYQTTSATVNVTSSYAYPSGVSKSTHALLSIEALESGVRWRSDQLGNVYMGDGALFCAPTADGSVNKSLRIVYMRLS